MSRTLALRLKHDLRSTTDLMELVDVLKRVAVSQFHLLDKKRQSKGWTSAEVPAVGGQATDGRVSQESDGELAIARAGDGGPALSLKAVLEDFFRLLQPQQCQHPFLESPSPPVGIVIVTSDEGFLGGLNSAVIQKALAARTGPQDELIVLGERGRMYLEDLKEPFTHFAGAGEHMSDPEVERLRDFLADRYLRRKVGKIMVWYPRPRSFTHQEVDSFQLLPYPRPSPRHDTVASNSEAVILEPSAYLIIEYLVKLWLSRKIHDVFWQSRLSELAARATHLEASFQGLTQQKKKLTLQYFRSRHEVTDTSIRESYAGMLGRKKEVAGRHE